MVESNNFSPVGLRMGWAKPGILNFKPQIVITWGNWKILMFFPPPPVPIPAPYVQKILIKIIAMSNIFSYKYLSDIAWDILMLKKNHYLSEIQR